MSLDREHPGNLPLLPMKLGAGDLEFNGPETFWADVERVTGKSGLGANLDLAMAGESSPRVWLFLHEPGQEGLSAAAALSIARQLAARDQAVLILDGDDQVCRLSRWAGRHEEEGWIDMVRYGASVLTSGTALPFPGRRSYLIGVGSFNPTEVELQEAHDLVARLRRQADDLILVAPHGPLGLLWARVADIRLFCWDQEERGAREMEDVCAEYEQAGDQLTGLVAYTGAVVDQAGVPSELDRSVEPEAETAPAEDEAFAKEAPAESEPVPGDEAPVSPEFEDQDSVVHDFGPAAEEDEPDSAGEGSGEDAGDEEAHQEEGDLFAVARTRDSGRGSSRVFWGFAGVAMVIVVVVSVFYWIQVRQPGPLAQNQGPQDQVAQSQVAQNQGVLAQAEQPGYSGLTREQQLAGDEMTAAQDRIDQEQDIQSGVQDGVRSGDHDGSVVGTVTPQEQGAVAETAVQDSAPRPSAQTSGTAGDEAASGEAPRYQPEPAADPDPARPVFNMAPFQSPVGQDGWALHVYSFSDSTSAHRECLRLKRRGFTTATRPVQLKEKGRWYRVYVGNFPNKTEALAARQGLADKLKLDYVRPTEF